MEPFQTVLKPQKLLRRYLSRFRSYVTYYTTLTILAVDFNVFPERFAKSKTFGTGKSRYSQEGPAVLM